MPTSSKKNLSPLDDYKFTLSNYLEDMARNELRETPEMRDYALNAFREWIEKNERIIVTRMDAKFLLRYLRFRKFSLPMAMEALERFLVNKSGVYGKHWMNSLGIEKPAVLKLLDKGLIFCLPERDYLGRLVIFFRAGVVNPKSPSSATDALILTTMCFENILEDEENQIRGVVHVVDARNITMSHITIFSPQYLCRLGKNTEKTLPLRHKAFHVVNVHKSINFLSNIVLARMSEKLQKRVHFYSSFDELAVIERSKLPKEYGGRISMADMIESTKQRLIKNQHNLQLYNQMRVNPDRYPKAVLEGSVKSLSYNLNSTEIYEKFSDDLYGVQGSFRKLEID